MPPLKFSMVDEFPPDELRDVASELSFKITPAAPEIVPQPKAKWFGQPEVAQDSILNLSALQSGPELFNRGMNYVGATIGNQLKKLPGPSDTVKDYWTKQIQDLLKTPQGKWAVDAFQRGGGIWDSFQRSYPEHAGAVKRAAEFGVNLATLGMGRMGVKGAVPKLGEKMPIISTPRLSTQPTKEEALGQILQGKTKDIAKGETALGVIDTSGVKTYTDLSQRISQAIPEYAKKVDAELAKDPNKYTLDWLATTSKTKSGTAVKQNYVETALNHLKELYEKTSDNVNAKEIEEMIARAKTEGLTKVEVNNIARKYGLEFGDKAFSATNEPLTSVNAESFQNIQKGLKNTARQGMSGEAKEGDRVLSSLMNTRNLIKKNIEAVRKLRQKVDERGLGEKIGRGFLTIMDKLTAGTVKGAVQKLLPRGLGYKTKNWIETEEDLKRNLKIINRAINAKSDAEIISIIQRDLK